MIDFQFEVGDVVKRRHGEQLWRVVNVGKDPHTGRGWIAKQRLDSETSGISNSQAELFVLVGRPIPKFITRQSPHRGRVTQRIAS
jgi:hypothetical protein